MTLLSRLTPYRYSITSSPEDPRLGQLIGGLDQLDAADIIIFGIPTDEGIRRNGGRIGASQAPDKIREYLAKLTPFAGPGHKRQLDELRIVDLGNVPTGELEDMHELARTITSELIDRGKFVIALGGGHDVSYPLVKGYALSRPSPSLINIDAHLDVRPKKEGKHHSGSSFRLLIEEGHIEGSQFTEFGIQPHAAAREHYEWLIAQSSQVRFFHELDDASREFSSWLDAQGESCYVTFDIDAIAAADAPGISAPAPTGFTAAQALELCYEAGNSSKVGMIDLVEVSPPHDIDDRTSRLVARMIANVIQGFGDR
ncbi:MAG TPA: formimidoylglutamase [Candidatus Kapabacteria bacterium]|nr:formimidoylglutamase [Candidatus Kapabacteria bacterium]